MGQNRSSNSILGSWVFIESFIIRQKKRTNVDAFSCRYAHISSTFVQYVHSFPGFSRLHMYSKGGSPVAFVEFTDAASAIRAMNTLQGTVLYTSERGGIRIEQAKSQIIEVRILHIVSNILPKGFLSSFSLLNVFFCCRFSNPVIIRVNRKLYKYQVVSFSVSGTSNFFDLRWFMTSLLPPWGCNKMYNAVVSIN